MKKNYFFSLVTALATILLLFAYSKEESSDVNPESNSKEVLFSSSILGMVKTKAINNSWESNDKIGVYMISNGSTLSESSVVENAANRKYHTADESTFSAYDENNKMYYPTDGANVDFIAYHPYKDAIDNYIYPVNVASQSNESDFLYSNNAVNLNQTSAQASLLFKHQLNKLVVNITAGEGLADAELQGMSVTIRGMPTTANFNLADKTISNRNGTSSVISMNINAEGTSATAIIIPHQSVNCGLVMGDNGKVYCGSQAKTGGVYKLNIR